MDSGVGTIQSESKGPFSLISPLQNGHKLLSSGTSMLLATGWFEVGVVCRIMFPFSKKIMETFLKEGQMTMEE